jgi:hypothetical protein
MRWLIAALVLAVAGSGAWLLFGLRSPSASAPPMTTPTLAAPPERAAREVAPPAAPPPSSDRAVPPPPQRAQEQTPDYYRIRLDRERRELDHWRAVVDSHPRDEGERRSAEAKLQELERQIHADEIRLEQTAPRRSP